METSELNQLRTEIAVLKRANEKQNRVEMWFKVIAAVGAVGTFAFGVWQYSSNNKEEFRKAIWKEQYALYQEACASAAAIATTKNLEDSKDQRNAFWRLYWGRLSVLEHPEVKAAMMAFGAQLREVEKEKAASDSLQSLSYSLARACRGSLNKTWNPADLGDIDDKK